MADRSQQTEKPTPRRIQKARDQGRYPQSKEALAAVTFAAATAMVLGQMDGWLEATRGLMRYLLRQAFDTDMTMASATRLGRLALSEGFLPLAMGGAVLFTVALGVQAAITGLGFSGQRLKPELSRLNSWNRIRQMPGDNIAAALQSLAVMVVVGAILWFETQEWLVRMLLMPLQPLGIAVAEMGRTLAELLKKALIVIVLLGAVDFARQRFKYFRELKMSKQEIRDEYKETEGNPQMKQRIRRLQRDAARRRMMEQVPKATAVIVNPTHFAVAIRFSLESMAAPTVVAKGRNYLARRIREIAIAHEVPIIENPPLARSLYKSVEVGQEVPAALYRAVAEVLAYLYRLMNGKLPGRMA